MRKVTTGTIVTGLPASSKLEWTHADGLQQAKAVCLPIPAAEYLNAFAFIH